MLIPAALLAFGMAAPASANCVIIAGTNGCTNPCLIVARVYHDATGKPAPFVCPL
jgi:hypothetical protein